MARRTSGVEGFAREAYCWDGKLGICGPRLPVERVWGLSIGYIP